MMRIKLLISRVKNLSMIALFMLLGAGGGSALEAVQKVRTRVCILEIVLPSLVVYSFVALRCHGVVFFHTHL